MGRRPPRFRIADMDTELVRPLLDVQTRQLPHRIEDAMLQRRRPPRRPEVKSDARRLKSQAVELDAHMSLPRVKRWCPTRILSWYSAAGILALLYCTRPAARIHSIVRPDHNNH